mgnify:FL=1
MKRSARALLLASGLGLNATPAAADPALYGGFALDPLFWLDMALGNQQTSCSDSAQAGHTCQPADTAGGGAKLLFGLRLGRQWALEAGALARKERSGSQSTAWTRAGYLSGAYSLHGDGIALDLRGGAMNWSVQVSEPDKRSSDSRWVPYSGLRLRTTAPRSLNLLLDLDWLNQAREPITGHGNPHAWQLTFGFGGSF